MLELNVSIGLNRVKNDLNSLINLFKVQELVKNRGLVTYRCLCTWCFRVTLGGGKTTVARLLVKIYKYLSVITTRQLVETDRSGLVAGYVGQTAIKTQEVISQAKGGVLFIDEAYLLTENRGGEDFKRVH